MKNESDVLSEDLNNVTKAQEIEYIKNQPSLECAIDEFVNNHRLLITKNVPVNLVLASDCKRIILRFLQAYGLEVDDYLFLDNSI